MSGQMRHPDTETLASFQAGLVSGMRSKRLAEHLSQCPVCASVTDQISAVSAALASVPAPALPADAEQRITAAITAEASARADMARAGRAPDAAVPEPAVPEPAARDAVTREAAARRTRREPSVRRIPLFRPVLRVPVRILVPAVACVLLAVVGYSLSRPSGPASPSAASARTTPAIPRISGGTGPHPDWEQPKLGSQTAFRVTVTHTSYKAATLQAQVRQQIQSSPAVSPSGSSVGPADSHPSQSSSPSGTDEVAPSQNLIGCVMHLTDNVAPTIVDQATYQSKPAYVIAVPNRAWVVPRNCTAKHPAVITSVAISPPA